jgi:cysteine desulfurase
MTKRIVYMDANATTAPAAEVRQALIRVMEAPRNAGSAHEAGRQARVLVDHAREQVASLLGAAATEVVFTSGSTEANALAIEGVAAAARQGGKVERRRIVSAAWEHHAVLEPLERLRHAGWDVVMVDVDESGLPRFDQLAEAINDSTLLVSLMAANNETGAIAPIRELSELCSEHGALLHSDATQAVPWAAVDVDELGVDLLSLSGHKMHGPQGTGALYVSRGVRERAALGALVPGGGQEFGLRGGTVNVAGVVGMGVAAELAATRAVHDAGRVAGLRDRLEAELLGVIEGAAVNGGRVSRTPGTTNICFGGVPAEAILAGAPDLAASTGSACRAGAPEPSHVLLSMGMSWSDAESSIRFSLSADSNEQDVKDAVTMVRESVTRVEEAMA